MNMRRPVGLILAGMGVLALTSACGATSAAAPAGDATSSGGGGASRTIRIVAAENFWGSIAGQLGGSHVQVRSVIAASTSSAWA
jgi:zinc/manganese transport system substrate-binding protein